MHRNQRMLHEYRLLGSGGNLRNSDHVTHLLGCQLQQQ